MEVNVPEPEIITIDSDSEDDTPWPIKEEFKNGDGLDETLNEVVNGIENGNFREDACPACDLHGPPGQDSAHKCAYCKIPVHAFGCSVANCNGTEGYGGNDRICLPCSRKAQPTKKISCNPIWKCFTCGNKDLELKTIQTPGANLGREYYGCYSSLCTREKPFLFWAPKDKSTEKIVSPDKRVNVTERKRRGQKRSNSEHITNGTEQQSKRPMRQIHLPLRLRKSYVFETP
ncbi:Alpha-aminoadipic semialdehyde dehydrogenase [Frankliniella fusca]|uniref:Alpha-aminoadipic semialdehyde dehydrogenase n=1 Tax=Frankliniella fusca TaxID=407009 RepID=A0AAE1HZ18_9NEOP|nr:Alpha-aminoadipic semialdehyde dehydrogenase [Frankliniella fusca]